MLRTVSTLLRRQPTTLAVGPILLAADLELVDDGRLFPLPRSDGPVSGEEERDRQLDVSARLLLLDELDLQNNARAYFTK